MKVPGDFSELVAGTPAEATGQAAAPTFDAPEQAQEGGDFRARLSKAADHISGQVERYADVDGFNQDVREVRALNELGKLTQAERQAAAMEDPAAKAEQDAYANLDKMSWRESDLILDKAAGSPSLMDNYTPPPGARPMDSEKAQEIAQSTLQKFGLADQAQVDASKERKLMDAVDATGLPRELLESGDPSATVRNFREQGGAVETFAKMHPVTAGFVNEFANLVRPDWQELSWPEQIGRNFMAGTMQGQAQVKLAMVMDRVRSQGMTPELMAEAWQYDKDMKNASGLPMDDWANKIAGNSAQQLPQFAYGATEAAKYAAAGLAMGVAVEVATGGALAVPMLAWGAKVGYAEFSRKLEGGLALWELLNMKDPAGNHLPYKAAAIGSDIVGGINAAIELWELDTIAKTIPGVRKIMADVGKEAALKTLLSPSFRQVLFQGSKAFAGFEAKEIGQEMLQELTQVASEEINKAYANKTGASFGPATMAEIKDRLYDIGEKTFWGMIPFGGPGVAWTTAKDAVQTPQARKLLDPFMAKIGADKLAQESPSVFERLIERNVQAGAFPGKVYMPSADVRALFQDKTSGAVDVEGLRAFLSAAGIDRQVFLDSLDHSADVAMDSKRLARVLATDAGAALHSQGNLTFSPGEREVARAEAQVEQAQATGDPERIAQAQATLKEVESGISDQDRATLDSLFQNKVDQGRSFKERIVSDMVAAGHTKAQARVAASLIDGNAQVWAENTGQTVEDYYKKFGYRIKKTNFGGILARIYQTEYSANFKSEAGFFERFNRDEGFRQEVLAKVNLGEPTQAAAQVVAPASTAPPQTQAPVATAAVTVPTATSSSQAAGASPAAKVLAGPTHEVVKDPGRFGGGSGEILTPSGEPIPFRYAVMERADVQASHLPDIGFAKNPQFAHTNERNYRDNAAFQQRVMERAMPSNFRPEFMVQPAVDALNGAPIVDTGGNVLGGNSRKMTLDLVFEKQPESRQKYLDALREALPALGLDPAMLDGMKEPILVRSMLYDYDAMNTAKLISAFNQDFKAALDARTASVSAAKFITPETANALANGLEAFDTLRAYLDDKASAAFVARLFTDGALAESERPRIIGPDGTLNAEGRDLVENILRGAIVDDYELMGRVKDGTMKKIDRVIPHMLRVMGRSDAFNIQPSFKAAVALLTSWQNGKPTETFQAYMNQAGLFVDQVDPRRDPVIARLALALHGNKELELARQFSAYADAAALNQPGRMALPGTVPSFEQALGRIGPIKRTGAGKTQTTMFQDKPASQVSRTVYVGNGRFEVEFATPVVMGVEAADTLAQAEGMARQVLPGEVVDAAMAALAQAGPTVESVLQDIGVIGPQGPVQMLYQSAWHGSPHRFEQFSLDHIGTGEGAAAYGWGLYFAEDKEVAEHYRKSLEGGPEVKQWKAGTLSLVKNGEYLDYSPRNQTPLEGARAMLSERLFVRQHEIMEAYRTGGVEAAQKLMVEIADLEVEAAKEDWPEGRIPFQVLRDGIKRGVKLDVDLNPGQLYKVEVPDAEHLLDWDKPAAEQPKAVLEALAKAQVAGVLPKGLPDFSAMDKVKPRTDKQIMAQGAKVLGSSDMLQAAQNDIGTRQDLTRLASAYNLGPEDFRRAVADNRTTSEVRAKILGQGYAFTGQEIYRALQYANNTGNIHPFLKTQSPDEGRGASLFLREQGIPGLRYLDGNSRGSGEGHHNYVIFDDAAISKPETFYQDRMRVDVAGAARNETDEAVRLWKEQKFNSPYFKSWTRNAPFVELGKKHRYVTGAPVAVEVYHGTPDNRAIYEHGFMSRREDFVRGTAKVEQDFDFQDPERSFWFTNDHATAKSYADDRRAFDYQNSVPEVMRMYVRMQNPKVIDWKGGVWRGTAEQVRVANEEGHDGVIILNVKDRYEGNERANPATNFVVFNPDDIKSSKNIGVFGDGVQTLLQDAKDGPRLPQGASVFSKDNEAIIYFFEAKDVSTAPHEIFHVFRRTLEDMAMHPSANEQVRADWAGACEFVGAKVGQVWTREQEEKWADAALTYLMEGKSPSQNLKGAFSRMADWLLAVYRSVRNMVSLSPEIRGVFDRLLATQDEIRAAEDRLQTVPLFTEKRSVDYEAALAELKQATEEEVRAYRMGKLNSLRKLWAKDGKAIADNAEHQKKIDALVEAGGVRVQDSELSSGNRASIKRHRPGKLLIGPDAAMSEHEAADMVGVPRLAFWAWLSTAQTKSAIVKEHVAAQERLFNDEFDVDDVMLSERLEKVLELEAKTLADALGGRSVPASALKAWVREKTGQTKADQALVGEFDALKEVLRRESMAARKAFREGKNKEALQAKERQRAALAELRTRIKDQKTALTIQARAVRISEAVLNKNSKVDWDWGEQVLRLVVHFGLNEKRKSIFPRQADTMPGLLQFIQAKDADGYETHNGNIPEWIYAEGQGQLGRQNPNHWKNLSMAQLREVDTALRYLYEAGKRERLYVTDGKEIELVTVADKLIRSMDGLKNVRRLADYQKSQPLGWLLNKKRQYIAEITNPEYLWDAVDGFEAEGARGKRTGPAWQYVRMALMQARSAELREYGRVAAAMDEIFHPMRERNVRERFTLEGVPLMSEVAEEWGGLWTYERLVSAALNMGNAGNLHALSAGFGWTQDHLALIAKQLTAAEWRMVQDVWDLVETLWPAVDQTFYALHGQHMQKVEALPLTVQTKDGQEITLRGGYYPLIGDHRLNDKAGQFAEADLMKNETMALFTPAKVKDSFTLKRTGMVLPPRLSLSVMSRHVQQAVHYATHGVAVRNLQRIITLPEFSAAFKAKFGEDQYRMLTPWLKNIARPDSPQLGFFEQTLEKWRTLGTISALGLNAQVAFLQVSSLPQSAQSIGWDYLAKAYSAMANPQNTATLVAFVRENSPLMRDRFHDMDRDMARNAKKFNPTDRKLQFKVGEQQIEVGMQEFHEFAMLPIAFADCLVTYPTWLAAFMKYQADNARDVAKGKAGKDVQELYRMADDAVIRAQAGGSAMNLSALQHGAGWRRLITMFASFTMNYQNRLRFYMRGVGEGKISKVDYARHLFNETILPVVLTSIMLKLLKDNELPDRKDLAWDFGGYLLSGFPIFRGMPRIMQYGMGGVMDSAAWRGVDLAAKSGQQLIKAATDQGKRSEHLLAFLKDATDMAGFAAGVPTVPIWRFAKGVHDLAAGSEKNPFRPFFSPSPDAKKK